MRSNSLWVALALLVGCVFEALALARAALLDG